MLSLAQEHLFIGNSVKNEIKYESKISNNNSLSCQKDSCIIF